MLLVHRFRVIFCVKALFCCVDLGAISNVATILLTK